MGSAYSHLLISHIPVVGTGFCLVLFVLGMLMRSTRVMRIGLFFVVLLSLVSIWVYISGADAAEVVNRLDSGAAARIADHKATAAISFVVMLVTGIACFGGLLFRRADHILPNWYTLSVAVLLIITVALMIGTAGMGLKISHRWVQPKVESETSLPQDTTPALLEPQDSAVAP